MNRRDFLRRVSVAPALAAGAGRLFAAADTSSRIGVTSWSMHNYFPRTRYGKAPEGMQTLTVPGFLKFAANKWQVRNFELVNTHFDSTEPAYLDEIKQTVKELQGSLYNICVDLAGTNLSDDDEEKRKNSVEAVKKWIDVAVAVGSPSIRCNTGRSPRGDAVDKTIASYKELAAYSGPKKVRVIIENHGGVSYVPEKIVEIVKSVGGPWIGTLPDFGNWPNDEVRYRGLEMVFPYAKMCHAKPLSSDPQGQTVEVDIPRCVRIARKAGFQGIFSVEYEGPENPIAAVPKVKAQLQQALEAA